VNTLGHAGAISSPARNSVPSSTCLPLLLLRSALCLSRSSLLTHRLPRDAFLYTFRSSLCRVPGCGQLIMAVLSRFLPVPGWWLLRSSSSRLEVTPQTMGRLLSYLKVYLPPLAMKFGLIVCVPHSPHHGLTSCKSHEWESHCNRVDFQQPLHPGTRDGQHYQRFRLWFQRHPTWHHRFHSECPHTYTE